MSESGFYALLGHRDEFVSSKKGKDIIKKQYLSHLEKSRANWKLAVIIEYYFLSSFSLNGPHINFHFTLRYNLSSL